MQRLSRSILFIENEGQTFFCILYRKNGLAAPLLYVDVCQFFSMLLKIRVSLNIHEYPIQTASNTWCHHGLNYDEVWWIMMNHAGFMWDWILIFEYYFWWFLMVLWFFFVSLDTWYFAVRTESRLMEKSPGRRTKGLSERRRRLISSSRLREASSTWIPLAFPTENFRDFIWGREVQQTVYLFANNP